MSTCQSLPCSPQAPIAARRAAGGWGGEQGQATTRPLVYYSPFSITYICTYLIPTAIQKSSLTATEINPS